MYIWFLTAKWIEDGYYGLNEIECILTRSEDSASAVASLSSYWHGDVTDAAAITAITSTIPADTVTTVTTVAPAITIIIEIGKSQTANCEKSKGGENCYLHVESVNYGKQIKHVLNKLRIWFVACGFVIGYVLVASDQKQAFKRSD